ncbi:zinc finger protein Xfin-like isoform X3 [Bolinopsis microptera]|uniref:zinc finger protein Xfin-like isoform X3 n=1 Tax=Bolinopsis microptera TaxID=2820187 RepID=UPI00307A61C0
MHSIRRPLQMGYEDGTSDDESGECWRLSSLSQPNTPHFCRSCMLGFRDRILLNNHLKQHYMENRAATSQGQTETEPAAKATSQDPMFRCLNCKETFLSPNQLKLHCEVCQPEDSAWQCEVCEELFEDKMQLNAHFISMHGEQNMLRNRGFECPHCRLVFESQQELKVHIEIDHEMQVSPVKKPGGPLAGNKRNEMYITVACECGKVFVNELDYQEHILEQHPGTEPLKWPKDISELKKRKRSALMAKRNMSDYQAKRSRKPPRYNPNSRINNQGHKYFDGSEEAGGVCVECGETFAQAVELKRHMQSDHIHLKPYACSICGRRFTRKSDVKRHIETIHGQAVSKEDMERIQAIRPFRCAKCGNPFGRYSDIKKHIEVHHGLPFSPDTYVYQLEHMEEAGLSIGSSGEVVNVRTYDCGLCKRKYRNKTTVRHHIRKDHNQEDPDAFITRSHFNHSEQECQFCGDVFNCIEDKMEHVQNIHQTMVEDDSLVDTPLSTVLQHEQEMVHDEGEDCENFMPVKDVSTPEKLRYNSKNQIVILKQELVNNNNNNSPAPPELRVEKKEGGTWSNTLINDIVSEQQRSKSTYDCPECSRSFTRPKALQSHILKMHSKKNDDFECDLCGRSYKEQKQFVKHLEVAHPEIRADKTANNGKKDKNNSGDIDGLFFNCATCGKSFQEEVDLKTHIEFAHAHAAAAPRKSNAIKESAVQQVVSTQSVSVDDMPLMEYYTCNVCGAMFSSTESLTRHMNLKHKDISILGRKTVLGGLQVEDDRQEEDEDDEDEEEEVITTVSKDVEMQNVEMQNVSVEYT